MEKELKDFQKATVKHIVDIFKSKKQRRVLLSDEVGLGKTCPKVSFKQLEN